jgi:hypothetical protein
MLSRIVLKDVSLWTVERVTETSEGDRRLTIPGMYAVASSSEAATFAMACDCIDRWLPATPGPEGSGA